jgi:hypothetical protein
VSPTANLQPPRRRIRNGGDEWVQLVTLDHRQEADDLVERLGAEAIDTYVVAVPRSKTGTMVSVASSLVIFVKRRQLDEARFLLAMVAFEGPSRSRPLSIRAVGALVAVLLSLFLLSAAILQPQPPGVVSCERGNLGGSAFRGLIIPCRVPEPAP